MAPNVGIDSATKRMAATTTDLNTQRFQVKSEEKGQRNYKSFDILHINIYILHVYE